MEFESKQDLLGSWASKLEFGNQSDFIIYLRRVVLTVYANYEKKKKCRAWFKNWVGRSANARPIWAAVVGARHRGKRLQSRKHRSAAMPHPYSYPLTLNYIGFLVGVLLILVSCSSLEEKIQIEFHLFPLFISHSFTWFDSEA